MTSWKTWIVLVCLELSDVIDVGWSILWPLLIVLGEYIIRGVAKEIESNSARTLPADTKLH